MAGLRAQRHIATRPARKLGAVSARVGPVALQRPEYPDLARVLSVARRRLWVILLAGLAFAALTRVAVGGPASYQAETTILVGPVGGTYQDLRASGQQAETYAQLATAGPVLVETARRLGTGVTVADLRRHITASADDVTRLLTLTVTAQSPRQAAAIARALTQELRVFTRAPSSAPPADSGGLTAHGMRVVNPPQPPSSAFGTLSHNALVGLAFFAGALFALALLVVRDAAKRRLLREEDLATASPAPVLGALAPRRGRGRGRARADRAAHVVAGRMLALGAPPPATVLTVAAPDGEGTADVALHLAETLAQDLRVVVVDGSPTADLTTAARLAGRPGLVDVATANPGGPPTVLADALVQRGPQLSILPRGGSGAGEAAIDAREARRVLARLQRSADVVIVAGGTVDEGGALQWAPVADSIAAVARRGRTTMDELAATVDAVAVGEAPVGTILAPDGRRRRRWTPGRRRGATASTGSSRPEAAPAAVT